MMRNVSAWSILSCRFCLLLPACLCLVFLLDLCGSPLLPRIYLYFFSLHANTLLVRTYIKTQCHWIEVNESLLASKTKCMHHLKSISLNRSQYDNIFIFKKYIFIDIIYCMICIKIKKKWILDYDESNVRFRWK